MSKSFVRGVNLGVQYSGGRCRHSFGRSIIDEKAQQLGSCVMTDRVHHAFSLGNQAHVEISNDHAFAFAQCGRKVNAFRRNDGRVAAAANGFL